MLQVDKSERAKRDLKEIWSYSFESRGEAQADRYLRMIETAIERLRAQPLLGADFGYLRADYRRLTVMRHRVFYVINGEIIDIVRVLHERMDSEAHLSDEV